MKLVTIALAGTALIALAGCNRAADGNAVANATENAAAATENAAAATDNAADALDNAATATEAGAGDGAKPADAPADAAADAPADAPAAEDGDKEARFGWGGRPAAPPFLDSGAPRPICAVTAAHAAPSSSGPGRRPLTAKTRVRVP